MENKESYTPEEMEKAIEVHGKYLKALIRYFDRERKVKPQYKDELQYDELYWLEESKKALNSCINECNEKLPKSLIDKLEIKKIE